VVLQTLWAPSAACIQDLQENRACEGPQTCWWWACLSEPALSGSVLLSLTCRATLKYGHVVCLQTFRADNHTTLWAWLHRMLLAFRGVTCMRSSGTTGKAAGLLSLAAVTDR